MKAWKEEEKEEEDKKDEDKRSKRERGVGGGKNYACR